jgi:hypothetical protein
MIAVASNSKAGDKALEFGSEEYRDIDRRG